MQPESPQVIVQLLCAYLIGITHRKLLGVSYSRTYVIIICVQNLNKARQVMFVMICLERIELYGYATITFF